MSDFEIDIYALDSECVKQPELCRTYGRTLANAQKALKEAESAFEVYKAKIADKIRDQPQKFNMGKTTVTAVQDIMRSQPKYTEYKNAVADAEHEVALAWADVHSINHKKDMLSDLVKLHGQQYFSEVPVTESGVAAIKKDKARRKGGIRRDKE